MVKGNIWAILVYILIYTFTIKIAMVFYFTSNFYMSTTLSVKCGNILILLVKVFRADSLCDLLFIWPVPAAP